MKRNILFIVLIVTLLVSACGKKVSFRTCRDNFYGLGCTRGVGCLAEDRR